MRNVTRLLFLLAVLAALALPAAAQSQPQNFFTGNITTSSAACAEAAGCVSTLDALPSLMDYGAAWVQVTGTWTATLQIEGTVDGSTWFSVNGIVPTTGVAATSTTANGSWQVQTAALTGLRLRASAYTSGTAVVSIRVSQGGVTGNTSSTVTIGTSSAGGYIRQDSNATIAKETGGNLASVKTNTDTLAGAVSGGHVQADIVGSLPVGGNLVGQVTIDQTTDGTTNKVYVGNLSADTAHGSVYTEAPVGTGQYGASTEQAVVDAGDKARQAGTLAGAALVKNTSLQGDEFEYYAELTDDAWSTILAGSANYYYVVTFVSVINADATVSTEVFFEDDADGAAGSNKIRHGGYAAALGGGWVAGNGSAPLFSTETAANGLYVHCGTTSSETHVTVRGYRTKILPSGVDYKP